jgi:ankyrin repeat protein
MHALCNRGGPQEINVALEKLPDTVDGCYANAIIRVHMKDSPREILACATLAWMSYACRPLKFPELRHAIAAQMSDSGSSIKREKLYDQERVTSVCCGLVEIDADDYVRFVHYSAEDYFRQRKESHFGNSRIEIPLACAKYLCMDVLKKPVRSTDSEESIEHRAHSEQLQAYPFAQYAAEHLHTHFKLVRNKNDRTEKQVELDQYIHQLVSEEPTREFYCRLLQDLQAYYTRSTVLEGDYSYGEVDATPLHLAVFLGRCDLVRSLLDRPSTNANEIDGYKQTPLVVAFKKDFGDIAEILLDHGATVDLSTRQGHVLLEYAAQRDYKKAVGKILATVKQTEQTQHLWSLFDLGVLLCSPLILILCLLGKMLMKSDGWVIPTQFPGENGTLVPDGKRSDHLLERYGRVLTLAYEGRSRELDEFIAIHPFDVDDCDQEDQVSTRSVSSSSECDDMGAQDFLTTACFLAVEGDHTSTVAVLLSRGVSANLTNFHGQPLLHRATFRKNIGLLELLLNGGADVNLQDNHERTAYTAHASIKHKAGKIETGNDFPYTYRLANLNTALRFLKSKGANIHHTNGDGVHELYRAAAFGNKEMVEFFLDAGVSACIANVYSSS